MADISYTPTTWADGSGGGTPIDATKLNNIESGIVDAVAAIGPNDTTADGTLKAQIDALGESVSKLVRKQDTMQTNSAGQLFFGYTNKFVLSVKSTSGNYAFVPYWSVSYGCAVIVYDPQMTTRQANTSITFDALFYEM